MLIKTPENNLKGVQQYKNEFWETCGQTPNEKIQSDPDYSKLVAGFARANNIAPPYRFFEVRIVKQNPSVLISLRSQKWWDDPMFMDRSFWMFQKPIADLVDGEVYSYYALEPYECLRVINCGLRKFGKMPVRNMRAAFIVPVECCERCWKETAGGVSEHIHHRPEPVYTQEHIDKQSRIAEEAEALCKEALDINETSFSRIGDKATQRIAESAAKAE